MFGAKARLEARIKELERRLEGFDGEVSRRISEIADQCLGDPEQRVRFLLNSVATDLQRDLAVALERVEQAGVLAGRIQEQAAAEGAGQERFFAELDRVYHAKATGYVAIYYTGGRPAPVKLLVGSTRWPDLSVGELDPGADSSAFSGGVVRRGEYWTAQSKWQSKSIKIVFTPFL
ncbi:hypothetical protein [Kitasatospora sp. NPDC085879]|jgi:hypothetical protein|uniref:hypothetical protein n=1 Tax=Kitasatospora sp. NPDC085879 TaxID=3154769 RepID=UPI00342E664D